MRVTGAVLDRAFKVLFCFLPIAQSQGGDDWVEAYAKIRTRISIPWAYAILTQGP